MTANGGASEAIRLETFSYLPAFDADEVRAQIDFALGRGWTCAVEHIEPARAGESYWYMWSLPMFGVNESGAVVAEIDACRQAHPGHHVKLIGYDSKRQTQGLSFVVYRAV